MSLRRWRLVLLLPIGIIGSALLSLWLLQTHDGRERRSAARAELLAGATVIQAHARHLAGRLTGAGAQALYQWVGTKGLDTNPAAGGDAAGRQVSASSAAPPTAAELSGAIKRLLSRGPTEVDKPGLGSLLSGVAVVLNGTKIVSSSNVAGMPVGKRLAGTGALDAMQLANGGLRISDQDSDAAGWYAMPISAAQPAATMLVRVDARALLQTALVRAGAGSALVGKSKHPFSVRWVRARPDDRTVSAQRIETLAGDTADSADRVARIHLPLSDRQAGIYLSVQRVAGPEDNLSGPLVFKILAGSALLTLVLAALGWRWQQAGAEVPAAMRNTLAELANGNLDARSRVPASDDATGFSQALDELLDRHATLASTTAAEQHNLEVSIDDMQKEIARMADQYDLGGRLPSPSDATGAIADAVNLLCERVHRVLSQVAESAQGLTATGERVRSQATQVHKHASRQINDIHAVGESIQEAFARIDDALGAARKSTVAVAAAQSTTAESDRLLRALLDELETARHQIRISEKRVKGLGERTQEIGSVVSVIADLAERTGIVALNASLQAAASDTAGRQFGPIASEVKRLADSAGEAAAQANTLLSAIREETAAAGQTINQALSGVVDVAVKARAAAEAAQGAQRSIDNLSSGLERFGQATHDHAGANQALAQDVQKIRRAGRQLERLLEKQAVVAREFRAHGEQLQAHVGIVLNAPADKPAGPSKT